MVWIPLARTQAAGGPRSRDAGKETPQRSPETATGSGEIRPSVLGHSCDAKGSEREAMAMGGPNSDYEFARIGVPPLWHDRS